MTRPTARITVVTSGHLSTCPRMLKSADALAAIGYDVSVVATRHEPWATAADRDVRSRRTWPVEVVNYQKGESGATYWWTGAQHRIARAAIDVIGPERAPRPVVARAFGRVHAALVQAVARTPADLIYGGTTGALEAIAEAARRCGTPYAVDFEDLHSAETSGPGAPRIDALAARVERDVIGDAAFLTTSSESIAGDYLRRYDVEPVVIHNTFPLPSHPPDFSRLDPATFKVYWFSQTIGPGRGLEDAIVALGRVDAAVELTLLGRPHGSYLDTLRDLATAQPRPVAVIHKPPAPPDAMVEVARGQDVGLALDYGTPRNRELCLPNKAFTYILAGIPVVMADTSGQHALGVDLGRGAALVRPGDVDALTTVLARWASDPGALDCAKRTAWHAASRRWHWEHESERGTLYRLVGEAVS